MDSNTGWVSVGELLMTLRISAVAACCSDASLNSRLSRATFVSLPIVTGPRRSAAFGARGLDVLRRCFLAALLCALSGRLIGSPRLRTRHGIELSEHTGRG